MENWTIHVLLLSSFIKMLSCKSCAILITTYSPLLNSCTWTDSCYSSILWIVPNLNITCIPSILLKTSCRSRCATTFITCIVMLINASCMKAIRGWAIVMGAIKMIITTYDLRCRFKSSKSICRGLLTLWLNKLWYFLWYCYSNKSRNDKYGLEFHFCFMIL